MSKAEAAKTIVIDHTPTKPAIPNRNNWKHLQQLDINTFRMKKGVTVSSECIEIDEDDDAGDVDAVAFDGRNLHNTCVCATMLPLDDSDGIPE